MTFSVLTLESLAGYFLPEWCRWPNLRRITMETCSNETWEKIVSNIWNSRHLVSLNQMIQISSRNRWKPSVTGLLANFFAPVWLWHVCNCNDDSVNGGCWEFQSSSRLRPCVCSWEAEGLLSTRSYSLSQILFHLFSLFSSLSLSLSVTET